MKSNDLSSKAKYELGYIIFSGLSEAMDNDFIKEDTLKELLDWYKDNVMLSYNDLKEKFERSKG